MSVVLPRASGRFDSFDGLVDLVNDDVIGDVILI